MYEITREFLDLLGKNVKLEDCPGGHNLWMDCGKAKKYGVAFRTVTEGLKKCALDYHVAVK